MGEGTAVALAAIFLLGIGAQWIAWRIRLPAILLLLVVGLIAGPGTGFLNPDEVFGIDLLLPIVSLSVAVILFEGGLNLKFKEIKQVGGSVISLVTVGMLVSWGVSAVAAKYILDFDWQMSFLIGGILVVTGPTVIGPLLRQIRPKKKVASLLKWEGILIDPIGALMAVLVFEAFIIGTREGHSADVGGILMNTMLVGFGGGLVIAAALVLFLRQFWIPDFLHSPFTLMVVIGSFALSNLIQHESGLLTVTVLGIAMANQPYAKTEHILEFKENLQVLLISSLFILLAARIEPATLGKVGSQSVLFLLVLVIIGRPLSVFISTIFGNLELKEKIFLSLLAPRGIVAASVASIFALELAEQNVPDADLLVPNVFFVIVGTVLIYGLGSGIVARKLGLADDDPQGVLFIGANRFSIEFGKLLKEKGLKVNYVDTNWDNVRNAKKVDLPAVHGDIMDSHVSEELDLDGIGKVFACTPNNDVNTLALIHLTPQFSNERSYQLAPFQDKKPKVNGGKKSPSSEGLSKRILFGEDMSFRTLSEAIGDGASIKATNITEEFTLDNFRAKYGPRAKILAVLNDGALQPYTLDYSPKVKNGSSIIFLLIPESELPVSA